MDNKITCLSVGEMGGDTAATGFRPFSRLDHCLTLAFLGTFIRDHFTTFVQCTGIKLWTAYLNQMAADNNISPQKGRDKCLDGTLPKAKIS